MIKTKEMNRYLIKIKLDSGDKLANLIDAESAGEALDILRYNLGFSYNENGISIKKVDSDEEKERKLLELSCFLDGAMETLDSIISDTFKNRNKK